MSDEITGARVDGVCPETGEPYTAKAGDAYVTPSGMVINSDPSLDSVIPAPGSASRSEGEAPRSSTAVAPGGNLVSSTKRKSS